jgi:hypothetical protein
MPLVSATDATKNRTLQTPKEKNDTDDQSSTTPEDAGEHPDPKPESDIP